MAVLYLIFNEGYAASSGETLLRQTLASEAIRLGRLLCQLLKGQPGPRGLLALMLLHDSRRAARVTAGGELVLLGEQDRTLWNRGQIEEGLSMLDEELGAHPPDAYAIQAAIAALHARAARAADTDWRQIVALYTRLFLLSPSPIVMLNHAVAVAMAEGPARLPPAWPRSDRTSKESRPGPLRTRSAPGAPRPSPSRAQRGASGRRSGLVVVP